MQTPFGMMQSQAACPDCGGVGKLFFKNGKQLDDG
jgi:DnaJ-class molecular chaperone